MGAHLVDLTKPYSPDQSHDAALVIRPASSVMDLSAPLKNIASIARPGGTDDGAERRFV
jgi:hypothetical protein